MKQQLLTLGAALLPLCVSGQDPSIIRMVNTGRMTVAPTPGNASGVSLYVANAFRAAGSSAIQQDGTTSLGGNFYQDSDGNAFVTGSDGRGTGSGKITFATTTGQQRTVTSSSISSFDRGVNYVAFPTVEIATGDELLIPSRMGIDATQVLQSGSGKIRLQSTTDGTNNTIDASMRITGAGSSASLVPAGAVIVERDVVPYRATAGTPTGNLPLFAFASPFENQRSGYYAGNWVRRLIANDANNGHVTYIYGDQSSGGKIIEAQYVRDPNEQFTPGKGYLVKLQPSGFDYSTLKDDGALAITNGNAAVYDKSKFIFDGNVYTLAPATEQVFAADVLYSKTVNTTTTSTVNWVIGNSYTAPLSVQAIAQKMLSGSLVFEPNIYVYPAGSTTYMIYKVSPNTDSPYNSMELPGLTQIPGMSIFMVRLSKGKVQNGTFSVGKQDLIQGEASHNKLRSANYNNEVLFHISPEKDGFLHDVAGVAMRQTGKAGIDEGDVEKAYSSTNELFQLYFMDVEGNKLAADILPQNTQKAVLCIDPGKYLGELVLSASRMESLSSGTLLLEDRLTGKTTDLMLTNGDYTFQVKPGDAPQRFVVHFTKTPTGMDGLEEPALQMFASKETLTITGLSSADIGSKIEVYDVQGRGVFSTQVTTCPRQESSLKLQPGIYIAKVTGKRSVSLKFRL